MREQQDMFREVGELVGCGLPEAKPIIKYGGGAEYKLVRLRETPFEAAGDGPSQIMDFYRANIKTAQWFHDEQECFCVIMLSTRRRVIGFNMVSIGTLDTILVHPREVFRLAIVAGAAAVVLLHNHPSGDPSPSEADIKVTRDLIRAGTLLKIEVLDHVIAGTCGGGRALDYVSLRELGYFYS